MPPTAVPATATQFAGQASHAFSADIARAISVLVDIDSSDIQRGTPFPVNITVQNTGAGHHFPTGSPFKTYRVLVNLIGEDGSPLVEPLHHDLTRTVEETPPYNTLSDSRLPAGSEVNLSWTLEVPQGVAAQDTVLQVSIQTSESEPSARILQDIPTRLR